MPESRLPAPSSAHRDADVKAHTENIRRMCGHLATHTEDHDLAVGSILVACDAIDGLS